MLNDAQTFVILFSTGLTPKNVSITLHRKLIKFIMGLKKNPTASLLRSAEMVSRLVIHSNSA